MPETAQALAPTQAEYEQLLALFKAGRFIELEQQASLLTRQYPAAGFAWKILGIALQSQGKDALAALHKAAELSPDDAENHCNLALLLRKLGQFEEAAASYRRALEINPDNANACFNLGNVLRDIGQHDDAAASYRAALAIKPDYLEAHSNLGAVLKYLGRFEDAVKSCRLALELNPDFAELHYNLGVTLREFGQAEDAAASYRRALAIKPYFLEAHNNLGMVLSDLRQFEDALACYRNALSINPDFVEAHYNLGTVLQILGKIEDALVCYHRVLELNPDHAKAHNNLGTALRHLGLLDDAVASYRRALALKSDYLDAHSNLGITLKDFGQFEDAMACFRRALALKPDYLVAHSNLLFTSNYIAEQPVADLLTEARRYGEIISQQAQTFSNWSNTPDINRCLRVGLVSGDLRNHPVSYFLESVVFALVTTGTKSLELFAYHNHSSHDACSERIKTCCKKWVSVNGLSDIELATLIRSDGIDILIDLSGHTEHNRLSMFAWKPAPLQASWLGYFATTGVAQMDYIIADPWTLPDALAKSFTEHVWRLPETRLCFTPPHIDVPVAALPALTAGYVTFGSFNNLAKMNNAVVALWARVLHAVAGSRLFLKTGQLDEASVRQNVIRRFGIHGIGQERLMLEGKSTRKDYFSDYGRIDIALDPFPFTGGTTSMDSLWMGVPVLTLAGDRFISRQGLGLMMNAGLADWVACDADDYVKRAVQQAGDLQRLSVLRQQLREQVLASPLCDAERFARNLEAALRGMWQEWCGRQ